MNISISYMSFLCGTFLLMKQSTISEGHNDRLGVQYLHHQPVRQLHCRRFKILKLAQCVKLNKLHNHRWESLLNKYFLRLQFNRF